METKASDKESIRICIDDLYDGVWVGRMTGGDDE